MPSGMAVRRLRRQRPPTAFLRRPERLRIAPDERTCLVCGETAVRWALHEEHWTAKPWHCPRCEDLGVLVPTVSFLRDGEYEIVR
jgi:hypothetical protein